MIDTERTEFVLHSFYDEYVKARSKHKPCANIFEALAVITKEVGELNQAVLQYHFEKTKNVNSYNIEHEAVQIGAMCIAIILEHIENL